MKILVISDSHGQYDRVKKVISRSDADAVLFLGDGNREIEMLSESDIGRRKMWMSVRGNCDWGFSSVPVERFFTWEGVNIFMLHGHTCSVKGGTGILIQKAIEKEADLVLYGHTHQPEDTYIPAEDGKKPLRVFNPGSIGEPRYGAPTFGYLLLQNGRVEISNIAPFEEE